MPVPVIDGGARRSGLYAAVREAIEEDARNHEVRVAGWNGGLAAHPYEMQRIIDARRAGEPTDVPPWAVPKWARTEVAEAARCVPTTFGHRPVVNPDDMFTVIADDGSFWLEVNGLLNDGFGMPPEQYDLYPTSTNYRVPR